MLFERLLEHCKDEGLVAAGGKQRTDSTHVISAVRDLNRLELAGESVRAALEVLAVAAPTWLAGQVDVAEFAHRYGPRVDGWRMPPSQTKRDRLAQVFGQDALTLCRAAWAPGAPGWIREIETVRALRQILVQTYYLTTDTRGREVIKKRAADDEGVPPGQLRRLALRHRRALGGRGLGPLLDGLQDPSVNLQFAVTGGVKPLSLTAKCSCAGGGLGLVGLVTGCRGYGGDRS
ncbi:hypothetical protein [Streptomyces sp. NPDC003952]